MVLPKIAKLAEAAHNLLRDYWPGYLAREATDYGLKVHQAGQAILTAVGSPITLKGAIDCVQDTPCATRVAAFMIEVMREGWTAQRCANAIVPYLMREVHKNAHDQNANVVGNCAILATRVETYLGLEAHPMSDGAIRYLPLQTQ